MADSNRILIAGGGPVGLFAALLLGRAGLPVRVFDTNPELQDDPRAATTHPATLDVLDQVEGLVEDMSRDRAGDSDLPVLGQAQQHDDRRVRSCGAGW